jgi:predicted small metal-binding protein
MKRLSCRDLGGPCDVEFVGESFEEIGKKSLAHVMEQMQKGDEAHLAAANNMRAATPEEQQSMMAEFKRKFDEAPSVQAVST